MLVFNCTRSGVRVAPHSQLKAPYQTFLRLSNPERSAAARPMCDPAVALLDLNLQTWILFGLCVTDQTTFTSITTQKA